MAFTWVTIVRVVQIILAIIVLGCSGYLVSRPGGEFYVYGSSRPGFNVFTSLWTILVCAFFLVVDLAMGESFLANPLIALALDVVCWIFWVAAFACLAAVLAAFDFAGGLGGTIGGTIKAAVAFGVFEWLLFSATAVWTLLSVFRGKKSGGGAPAHQGV